MKKIKKSKMKQRMMSVKRSGSVSYNDEAQTIISRARNRQPRVVAVGPLVFFSTRTGDAWMLDPKAGHARCLARDGDALTYSIVEDSEGFHVEWNASYSIEGGDFIVAEDGENTRTITGYPTAEIVGVRRGPR